MAKKNQNSWSVAREVSELGFVIALPLLALILLGRFLDNLLGYKVLFTLLSLPSALIISGYIVYKKIKKLQ